METVPPFCKHQAAAMFSTITMGSDDDDFLNTEEELPSSPILFCFKSSSSASTEKKNENTLKRKRRDEEDEEQENIFEQQEEDDFCTDEDLCEQDTKRRRLSLSTSTAPSSNLNISMSQEGPESAPSTTSTIPASSTTPSTAIAPSPSEVLRPTTTTHVVTTVVAASQKEDHSIWEQQQEQEGFQEETFQETLQDLNSRSTLYEEGKKAFISRGLRQIQEGTPMIQKWVAIVFQWLDDVLGEMRAKSHLISLHAAASYFLRILCQLLPNQPVRDSLQKIATACLIIAMKREEREEDIPSINKFVELTSNTYSRKEIIDCESDLLNILEWDLEAVTPAHFLEFYLAKSLTKQEDEQQYKQQLAHTAESLIVLALLAPRQVITEKYSDSMIAAAAVKAARSIVGLEQDWTPALEEVSSFSSEQLVDCSRELSKLYNQEEQQEQQ